MQNEDCFYWCEPTLGYFQVRSGANIRLIRRFQCVQTILTVMICETWRMTWCVSKTWLEEFEFDVNFTIFGLKIQLTAHFKRCKMTIEYGEINTFTPLTGATAQSMVFDNSMANPNFKLTYIIYFHGVAACRLWSCAHDQLWSMEQHYWCF